MKIADDLVDDDYVVTGVGTPGFKVVLLEHGIGRCEIGCVADGFCGEIHPEVTGERIGCEGGGETAAAAAGIEEAGRGWRA